MYEYGMIVIIMLAGVGFFAYVMAMFNSTIADYNEMTNGDDNLGQLYIWFETL
jgi:hypothetical protein